MKKILIIDDEMYLREYMAKLLENRGFRVVTTGNGEDGISLYARDLPEYVFLDVLLPGIDGEEVFRRIKSINQNASIIFITGTETIFPRQNAMAMGARGYLVKPILPNQLLELIREAEKTSVDTTPTEQSNPQV